MLGTVKWFNESKGFGFIAPSAGGKDVFVHITAVRKAGIKIGDGVRLSFDIERGQDGRTAAVNLTLADKAG